MRAKTSTADEQESVYLDALMAQLKRNLEHTQRVYLAQNRSLSDLGTPEKLASRMTASVPLPSPWDKNLGPFYGTGQVRQLLGGITRQAVDDRVRRRRLLALRTADRKNVYPTFQFDRRGQVLAGLPQVLSAFSDTGVDGWTLASWLRVRRRRLNDNSVVEWLQDGGEVEQILPVAREAAKLFAR
jgi:hypothetical protein